MHKYALVVIDMQRGFLDPSSPLYIAGAAATVPACAGPSTAADRAGVPVVFAVRHYRADGSDVERARYDVWAKGGKPLSETCPASMSDAWPEEFRRGRRLRHREAPVFRLFPHGAGPDPPAAGRADVILTGTTTPNCIRTTCYDAIALEYNTVVLTDCCSSHTEEIQRVNLEDMARAGAILMDSASFADYGPGTVEDLSAAIRPGCWKRTRCPSPSGRRTARYSGPTSGNHKGKRTPSAQLRRRLLVSSHSLWIRMRRVAISSQKRASCSTNSRVGRQASSRSSTCIREMTSIKFSGSSHTYRCACVQRLAASSYLFLLAAAVSARSFSNCSRGTSSFRRMVRNRLPSRPWVRTNSVRLPRRWSVFWLT
mgnify:CR=1 FL=1